METKEITKEEKEKDQQQQQALDQLRKKLERKDTETTSYQVKLRTKQEEANRLQQELGKKQTKVLAY